MVSVRTISDLLQSIQRMNVERALPNNAVRLNNQINRMNNQATSWYATKGLSDLPSLSNCFH